MQQFNRRLTISEDQMYRDRSEASVQMALETIRFGRTLRRTRRSLTKLLGLLDARYPREAALDSEFEDFIRPQAYFPNSALTDKRPRSASSREDQ